MNEISNKTHIRLKKIILCFQDYYIINYILFTIYTNFNGVNF